MKKIVSLLTGLITFATMSLTAIPVSATLERIDSEEYDFYSCVDYYRTENGETTHSYEDRYYKFTSDFSGTYHQFSRKYSFVFITIVDDSVSEKLDSILGEHEDTVYYYHVEPNQVVYRYSADVDYESLYDIEGVEKVELAKTYVSGDFSKDTYHTNELEEYGIDPYDNNLLMSIVTTDDSLEPTIETFDSTGYDVKAVLEGYSDDFYVYYEYKNIDSYIEFDEQARKIDGILSSNVSFLHYESVTESANLSFDTVENEAEFGDVNYDNVIDLYDAIEISKHIMGIGNLDEDTILLADINRDGETNLYDAVDIAKTLMT